MTIRRMEHVGIVVDDLEAATEFFTGLGLELRGRGEVEGEWADRIIGLEGTRSEVVMLASPEGGCELELSKFHSPPAEGGVGAAPSNALGIRHITFVVDDLEATVAGLRARGYELVGTLERYKDIYLLCYVRGPEGIIVELVEELG